MFWNHRVMRRIEGAGTSYEEEMFYIVEVYYDSTDNTIIGWTEREAVYGSDLEEIRDTLEWMEKALEKPILDEAELLAQAEASRASDGAAIQEIQTESPVFDMWEDDGGQNVI